VAEFLCYCGALALQAARPSVGEPLAGLRDEAPVVRGLWRSSLSSPNVVDHFTIGGTTTLAAFGQDLRGTFRYG
jgi:hypothetical protein